MALHKVERVGDDLVRISGDSLLIGPDGMFKEINLRLNPGESVEQAFSRFLDEQNKTPVSLKDFREVDGRWVYDRPVADDETKN